MKKPKISVVEKLPPDARVRPFRAALLSHAKSAKREELIKGMIVSYGNNGDLQYDFAGLSRIEALALIEDTKYIILRDWWN